MPLVGGERCVGMNAVIRETEPIARKAYECNACLFLQEYLNWSGRDTGFTISELRAIVKARRNGWQIQPGERYLKQVQKFEGEIVTVRCVPAIDMICHKYDLYPEW